MTASATLAEPNDARLARRAGGLLRAFNEAGVLDAADVHVASRIGALGAVDDERVLLATALAARAPRLGHVCVDLSTIAATASTEEGEAAPELAWPEPRAWLEALGRSPLVGAGRPLQLEGSLCYLDRLHGEECRVAMALAGRAGQRVDGLDEAALADGLEGLFPDDGAGNLQRRAAEVAVRRRLAVIAGGPGTGKTTTVARVLALLEDQARATGSRPPLVALAAPTGKAAARLQEAVRDELGRLERPIEGSAERWTASTLHRLLGTRPDSSTRFRHDEAHPLVHDVVVVDEASMLPLSLMDRLLAAVRAGARLVLLGDPEQLASVEAGVVLGDIVEPVKRSADTPMADSVVILRQIHRFGGGIADLAAAVRDGDAASAVALLGGGRPELSWIPEPPGEAGSDALGALHGEAVEAWARVARRAAGGEAAGALEVLGAFRVLCAHRHGPVGATGWTERLERWLVEAGVGEERQGGWHPGQPLLVTVNDYDLRLFNGDTGVVVAEGSGRLAAAFGRGPDVVRLSPSRLSHVETCYAMTIHKAQGSQFDAVAVVLPEPGSRILTRELLYTAITRARHKVTVVGDADSVAAAIERPIARASGLQHRLAATAPPPASPPA